MIRMLLQHVHVHVHVLALVLAAETLKYISAVALEHTAPLHGTDSAWTFELTGALAVHGNSKQSLANLVSPIYLLGNGLLVLGSMYLYRTQNMLVHCSSYY